MLLKNIKPLQDTLEEGVIPPHITMTLQQIIDAGKFTNSVQIYILGSMLELFKSGEVNRWPREMNNYSMTVSSDFIDEIKALPDADVVLFTEWVLIQLAQAANYEAYKQCPQPEMTTAEYITHVTKKQN